MLRVAASCCTKSSLLTSRLASPVASRSIARRRGDTLSAPRSATSCGPDEEGYLHQPHTSAGRIPTEKLSGGYVQSLTLRRMAAAEIDRLRAEFGRLEQWSSASITSRMLMDMTLGFGIAAAIRQISPALEHIERGFVAGPPRANGRRHRASRSPQRV